jgi:hypothetical protein
MIVYHIKHHTQGRIRIEVPLLRKLSLQRLKSLSETMSNFSFPAGIKNINPDPFTASIVITYNPKCIDIPDYLEKLAKDDAFLAFFWTDEKR